MQIKRGRGMGVLVSIGWSLVVAAGAAHGQEPSKPIDWRTVESPVLTGHVQLTSREKFIKAGEAYFNPEATWIIFQAIAMPPGGPAGAKEPEAFYQMYVAELVKDASGAIIGMKEPLQLSAPGSSNTCGWFHPTQPGVVLFGSTLTPPSMSDVPGYQRQTGRYVWQFHREMRLVMAQVLAGGQLDGAAGGFEMAGSIAPTVIFETPAYAAEASWSRDGRHILYAEFDRARSETLGRNHLDVKVFDQTTGTHTALVTADGYNGGPFFSPDGSMICYRSDHKGDSLLQLFVAELKRDAGGAIVGIEREYQLTDNQHVQWAPYWHPSGQFLVYASSEISHRNYEVFAIPVDLEKLRAGQKPAEIPHTRITQADGADVLPVFSNDGQWLMWTGQRGPVADGEQRPSSQLWIARFNREGVRFGGK